MNSRCTTSLSYGSVVDSPPSQPSWWLALEVIHCIQISPVIFYAWTVANHSNSTQVNYTYRNMCSKSNVATHAVKNSHGSGSNSHTIKEKHTPSALRRMTPLIISGYIFNTICYFAVKHLLPSTLTPDPKWCPPNEPNCDRRDLFAFQVVSLLNLSFLGLLGFYSFYISNRATKNVPQTPQGRYFGHLLGKGVLLPDADYINAVIVIFQGWDFIASIPFEEHCTPIMMTHHTLAFICGFACLWYEVSFIFILCILWI